jgi:flagellar motor switch protein FliN
MTGIPDAPAPNPAPEIRAELHSELRPELQDWCEAWKTCFQNVLSQISGNVSGEDPGKVSTTFEISPQPLAASASDLWYTVVAGGAVHGEMALRVPAASATRLARKFLGETEPAGENTAAANITPENISSENKDALEELLRQIAGLAGTALAAAAGGAVKLSLSATAAPSWSSDAIVCLQTRHEAGGGTPIAIEIRISPALAAALPARAQSSPNSSQASSSMSSPFSTEPPPNASYRRLMDVGLDVKLRFGTRRMPLRDILGLSAGVVVELDNALQSPVDLLLDGRLIAQGEVVVVDGKYGLRVTDVVDPAPSAGTPG